jgi:hypothetical protein
MYAVGQFCSMQEASVKHVTAYFTHNAVKQSSRSWVYALFISGGFEVLNMSVVTSKSLLAKLTLLLYTCISLHFLYPARCKALSIRILRRQ